MSDKTFSTGAILSAYTGYLVTDDFADVHEVIEHLAGGPVWTHQLGPAMEELKPALLAQLPWLSDIEVPVPLNGEEHCQAWVALVSASYGAEHRLSSVEGGWSSNPIADMVDLVGADRVIPIVLDGGESS